MIIQQCNVSGTTSRRFSYTITITHKSAQEPPELYQPLWIRNIPGATVAGHIIGWHIIRNRHGRKHSGHKDHAHLTSAVWPTLTHPGLIEHVAAIEVPIIMSAHFNIVKIWREIEWAWEPWEERHNGKETISPWQQHVLDKSGGRAADCDYFIHLR